jgi:putative membrane protein
MLFKLRQKRGVILLAIGMVATLWLGATKQLNLYVHPRYNTFSIVASVLGVVILVSALRGRGDEDGSPRKDARASLVAVLLVALSFVSLLVIKPAALSSNIANQRGVNSGANTDTLAKLSNVDVISPFGSSSTTQLTIKDWSSLLSQTNDQAFFVGKQAKLTGFITPDESDKNVFFVSRFVVSCCAVDARPIGVPVYKANWRDVYAPDQWVDLEGAFAVTNQRLALKPTAITPTDQPKDPYVY